MHREDDYLHAEEEFLSKDRKIFRKERKLASRNDRSQFKKSDQDQIKKRIEQKQKTGNQLLLRGLVLAIILDEIQVDCEGVHYACSIKGVLKKDKRRMKNLVAVGDLVRFEKIGASRGCILHVEERSSILSRADHLLRRQEQVIAVNVDQVLITSSVVAPVLKPHLIDRYIIASQKGNMKPIIVINKIDYFDDDTDANILAEEKRLYEEFLAVYRHLQFTVIPVSTSSGQGIELLREVMKGSTSVFSGQSGVGKSSLINALLGCRLPVGDIVQKTSKGMHTTSRAHLMKLEGGGFCIDTPGIRSFGLWDLKSIDVKMYFSEIFQKSKHCRFPDCSHLNEPGCAVKTSLEEGGISRLRFASYCALMSSLEKQKRGGDKRDG